VTLLVCHREAGRLNLYADTRISGAEGALSETGPKILTLPIRVSHGHPEPLPPVPGAYGFALAGSTLAAMSAFALASNILQSLVTPEPPRLPSVAGVAELLRKLGEHYGRETGLVFEGFVVGPDSEGGEPFGFSIGPAMNENRFTMVTSELDRDRRGLWALGSGAAPYMEFAQAHRPWPAVLNSVRAFIAANVDPKVGGHLQVGRCEADGFSPHMMLEPGTDGLVTASFLGVRDDEIGLVDGLDLGVDAMGPPSAFCDGAFSRQEVRGAEGTYRGFWRAPAEEPS